MTEVPHTAAQSTRGAVMELIDLKSCIAAIAAGNAIKSPPTSLHGLRDLFNIFVRQHHAGTGFPRAVQTTPPVVLHNLVLT
jgi:hypothetical protein